MQKLKQNWRKILLKVKFWTTPLPSPPPPQFYYFLNPEFMTCADTHKTQASQMDIDQREKPWGEMCVSLTQNHSAARLAKLRDQTVLALVQG